MQKEKRRAEENLTLIKQRGVRSVPLNKAVLKAKEAKKIMNNVIFIITERKKNLKVNLMQG